jgi:hypothetical protein
VHTRFWWENPKEKYYFEDLGTEMSIILSGSQRNRGMW